MCNNVTVMSELVKIKPILTSAKFADRKTSWGTKFCTEALDIQGCHFHFLAHVVCVCVHKGKPVSVIVLWLTSERSSCETRVSINRK